MTNQNHIRHKKSQKLFVNITLVTLFSENKSQKPLGYS